jgi:hypothetical protein
MSGLLGLSLYSLGALLGAYLVGSIFRHALLGSRGTKLQQFSVFQLMGITAIGVGAVGEGEGGFVDRIANAPSFEVLVIQPLAALLVGAFVLLQRDDDEDPAEAEKPKGIGGQAIGIAGRAIALLVVVPMIVVGLVNIGMNLLNLAGFQVGS